MTPVYSLHAPGARDRGGRILTGAVGGWHKEKAGGAICGGGNWRSVRHVDGRRGRGAGRPGATTNACWELRFGGAGGREG